MSEPVIDLDPGAMLATTRRRYRQHMADAAAREADLLDEIASLETYCSMLRAQLAKTPSGSPDSDAWGDPDPANP